MDYRKVGQQKSAQHHLQHQHDNSSGSSGNTGTAPPISQSTTSTTATTEQQIPVSGGGATSSGGEQQSQKQSAASQEVLQPSSAQKSDTTRSTVAATPSTNAQVPLIVICFMIRYFMNLLMNGHFKSGGWYFCQTCLNLPNSGRRAGRGCAASTTKPRWWWRGRVSCCFSCLPLSNKGARFIRNSTTSLSCIGVGINR